MLAGLAAGAALLLAPLDAGACSCVPLDPWDAYARSDAAIVGVFQGKEGPTTYRFRVEESFKAELRGQLDVRSADSGAACGLEVRVHGRVGLFLTRDGDEWRSNLCSQAKASDVRLAARGLPKPNGKGAIRYLVGGSFGPARIQALDAEGRTLAYGREGGSVSALAVCGPRLSLEVVDGTLAFRDLRTFRVTRSVRLGRAAGEWGARPHCAGPDAYVALFNDRRSRLLRIRGRSVRTVAQGERPAAAFAGRTAYLASRTRIFAVDLRTGRRRTVAGFTAEQLSADRAGSHLAALGGGTLSVIELRGQRRVHRRRLGSMQRFLVWDRDRVATLGWEGGAVYDAGLRLKGRLPSWGVSDAVGVGGRVVGVGLGAVRVASLPRGPVRMLRDLVSPHTAAIAAVDRGPDIELAVTLPCARG